MDKGIQEHEVVEQSPMEGFEEALSDNEKALVEVEALLDKISKIGLSDEQKEKALYELGRKTSQIINKIDNEEGGKLFDALRSMGLPDIKTETISIGDHDIIVNTTMDRFDLYSAIALMADLMEQEKNNVGYRQFVLWIDDFEFMFYISFFTNIGYHSTLEGYIQLRALFDRYGLTDKFYGMIANERKLVSKIFNRLYDLWEEEHMAIMSYIPHGVSAVNQLSERLLNLLGDGSLDEDISLDPDIHNLLLEIMHAKNTTENPAPRLSPDTVGGKLTSIFQERELNNDEPETRLVEDD
jgi:hypothetical protein